MMRHVAAVLLLAAACGGGTATRDGGADTRDAPPKVGVAVHSFSGADPAIFEYRDGSGAWQDVPAPSAQGISQLEVTTDYEVLLLCTDAGSAFDATMVAATAADGNQFMDCFVPGNGGTQPPNVAVTGTMQQAGSVQMGDTATGATSPWSFSLQVPAGHYDIAGIDTAQTRMLLRRTIHVGSGGLAITPPLDLATEGAALLHVPLVVTGLAPGAELQSDSAVFADTTLIDLGMPAAGSDGPSVLLPPPSLLDAADFTELQIDAIAGDTEQTALLSSQGSPGISVPSPLAMLPVLSGITFTAGGGTVAGHWTTLPSVPGATVHVFVGNDTGEHGISATPAWLALHGTTSLAFDTTAKGFKAIWDIDTTQAYFAVVQLSAGGAGGVSYSTELIDPDSAGGLRALRRRAHARQVIGASRKILP